MSNEQLMREPLINTWAVIANLFICWLIIMLGITLACVFIYRHIYYKYEERQSFSDVLLCFLLTCEAVQQ